VDLSSELLCLSILATREEVLLVHEISEILILFIFMGDKVLLLGLRLGLSQISKI